MLRIFCVLLDATIMLNSLSLFNLLTLLMSCILFYTVQFTHTINVMLNSFQHLTASYY